MFNWFRIIDDCAYQEQVFLVFVFVASLVVSFLFGYLVFRYEDLGMCRGPIEVLPEIDITASSKY